MVKPGFKQTEIGVIPEDWDCREINSEIKEISMGPFGSDIPVSSFTSEGVPVLNGHSVSKVKLIDTFKNYVSEEKAKSLKKAVAQQGDIIVTHRGTIGQISYIPIGSRYKKYVISQSQFRVRLNEDSVNPHFVASYFLSPKGQSFLLEKKGHTGVPALAQPTTNFRKLCIPLPSLPEQDRIVNAFEDIDDLISLLEKKISKKKAITQGATQELLTGKRRLPGFSENWQTIPLKKALSVGHGMSQHDVACPTGRYPILATGGVIGRANRYLWNAPSVLIGRKGTINKPKYMDKPFWSIDTLFYTKINEGYCPKFLYYVFCRIDWLSYNEASGVPSLSSKTIESIEVQVPDYREQCAIAGALTDIDTEIEALEQKSGKYRQVKQGMMQQLLTGKIRLV